MPRPEKFGPKLVFRNLDLLRARRWSSEGLRRPSTRRPSTSSVRVESGMVANPDATIAGPGQLEAKGLRFRETVTRTSGETQDFRRAVWSIDDPTRLQKGGGNVVSHIGFQVFKWRSRSGVCWQPPGRARKRPFDNFGRCGPWPKEQWCAPWSSSGEKRTRRRRHGSHSAFVPGGAPAARAPGTASADEPIESPCTN